MTPPDQTKRPSARPLARRSAPPPAAPAMAAPAPESATTSAKKKPKNRASARRGSIAPPEAPPIAATPAAPAKPAAAAKKDKPALAPAKPAAKAAASAKTSSAKDPGSNGKLHATPVVPYDVPLTSVEPAVAASSSDRELPQSLSSHDFEDNDDIFGDSGAVPMAALSSYPLSSEPEETSAPKQTPRGRDRLTKSSSGLRKRDEVAMVGSAQQLDSSDYYFRQYGVQAIRNLSSDVDDFGLDPHFEERARPALEALVKRYFRVDVDGAQRLPQSGRALIVANHAGALPWDGLVLRTALRVARPSLPPVRWLAEDTVFHYPFLGVTMNRLGAVRACQENAERLLSQDRLVAVFPEGAQGSGKLFRERYRLQRFGRGGYVKLALKLGAPIIPTAIIGAEETNPLLGRVHSLGRALGANFLPITPTFPWLGPLGLLPAPVKWRVVVGEPIDLSSYGEASADDALTVHRLNEQIRSIVQALVDQAKVSRRSVLFG